MLIPSTNAQGTTHYCLLNKANILLKLENDELLEIFCKSDICLVRLNQKLKNTENEKLSLVTALKSLHRDSPSQAQTHANDDTYCSNNEKQDYSLVNRKKGILSKKTLEVINLDTTAQDQSCNVDTRNCCEVLDDELLHNNNSNAPYCPTYEDDRCASCAVINKTIDDDMTSNARRIAESEISQIKVKRQIKKIPL